MTPLERCVEQENRLKFAHFTRDDALKLGIILYEEGKKTGRGVSVRITVNQAAVFQILPAGTTENNERWMQRKHRMVMARGTSSERARLEREADGRSMESMCLDPMEFSVFGGGFPIVLKGSDLMGSVCVSGLAGDEDHAFVVAGIEKYLGQMEEK